MGLTRLYLFWLLAHLCYSVLALTCPKDLCQCNTTKNALDSVRVKCGGNEQHLTGLKEISFGDEAHHIVALDLSKNSISRLEQDDLRNFTELKRLDLSSNILRDITTETFGDALPNLERLKLSNNSIRHIYVGAFEGMPNLKTLDISGNPLICDCDLIWLLAWSNDRPVKLQPSPKCESPVDFKGVYLKKLRVGIDLHCETPLQPLLELLPRENQLVFEGDELLLKCRAPRVAIGIPRESEDLPTQAHVFWGWSAKVRRPNSTEDIVFSDPSKVFNDVQLETKHITDSGLLNSILRIAHVRQHHSGMWDCTLSSQQANLSKAIVVVVISKDTLYCEAVSVRTNKGLYYWPRTVRGETVQQQCAEIVDSPLLVSYQCGENGTWAQLNADSCPFVSETTRILEQFAKMNFTLTKANALEIARRLHNFTQSQMLMNKLRDPMDLEFIARTLLKYLEYVKQQMEIARILVDIVSELLLLPSSMFEEAQRTHRTGLKMLQAVEEAATHIQPLVLQTPNFELPPFAIPKNIFIDYFNIQLDSFAGISCVWYNRDEPNSFDCSTSNDTFSIFERYIDAAIQVPVHLLIDSKDQRSIRLMVAAYRNGNLLRHVQLNESAESDLLLTSPVIGIKLASNEVETALPPLPADLSDKMLVILRAHPYHSEVSAPIPVWWDEEAKAWNTQVCQTVYTHRGLLMFTCSKLGYYGLLQRREFLNDFVREDAGALFRFAPFAIYVGCAILFICSWINIVTFIAFSNAIRINRQQRHSFVNTWLAVSALALVFAIGIYQTEYFDICKLFGILLHYFTLCVLLWLCVSLSNLYKRLSKTHRVVAESDLPKEVRLKKPILGIYLVGWGIGMIICGISSAVNISEYASYSFCFLHNASAMNAVLVPAVILLIFLGILLLCIYYHINKKAVNVLQSHQFSDNTQATEHIDMDWLDSTQSTARARAQQKNQQHELEQYRSLTLSNPLSSIVDDFERSNMAHLRAHFVFLLLFVIGWIAAAMFVMQSAMPIQQLHGSSSGNSNNQLYSVIFAIACTLLGLFLLLFYTLSRNDTRNAWGQSFCCAASSYQPSCQSEAVYDVRSSGAQAAAAYKNTPSYDVNNSGSRSNSQCSKHRASSVRSMKSNSHKNERASQSIDCPLLGAAASLPTPSIINNQQHGGSLNASGLAHDIPSAELFYNPNQINVARKFFKKQKRLAKRNNFELQRQMDRFDFPDNISDVSSLTTGSGGAHIYSKRHNAVTLLRGGSKVNNTNIHYKASNMSHCNGGDGIRGGKSLGYNEHEMRRFGPASSPNNCSSSAGGGFIAVDLDLVANIYTNIPETRAPQHEIIKMKATTSRSLKPIQIADTLSEHEDEQSSREESAPPLYENTPICTMPQVINSPQSRKPILTASTPLREVDVKLDLSATQSLLMPHDDVQAMNSLGLPTPPELPEDSEEEADKQLALQKDEIYVSNSLQITNRVAVDENFPAYYLGRQPQHSKSLNNLNDSYTKSANSELHESTSSGELSKAVTAGAGNWQRSSSALSMDAHTNDSKYAHGEGNCDSVSENNVYNLPHTRTLSASPTNGSDLNYQNSEISIRSHGLYAPQADNELNLTLTEDFPYQSSNASEADDVLNDFDDDGFANGGTPLSNDMESQQSAADNQHDMMMDNSIDELYEAIKRRNPNAETNELPNAHKTEESLTNNASSTIVTAINESSKSFRESLNDTIEDDSSQSSVISYIDPKVNRN